jgi:hypothetical protein
VGINKGLEIAVSKEELPEHQVLATHYEHNISEENI